MRTPRIETKDSFCARCDAPLDNPYGFQAKFETEIGVTEVTVETTFLCIDCMGEIKQWIESKTERKDHDSTND